MALSECMCDGCELKNLFFEFVEHPERDAMCTQKIERSFKKGEYIIREGEPIFEFTYLKSGLVKLFKGIAPEREQIICFAGPLDFVSLLSIFSVKNFHYSVVALEDSVICSLRLDEVKRVAEMNGRFAINLLEKINKTTDSIVMTMLEVKKKRLLGRIAYILVYFSEDVYKSPTFELPVSRKEIAEFIGMTTENVIRALADFRKDGIIKIFGKVIEIVDMDKLKKINALG